MYKKAWYTCKVVVLSNKPIAFLTSWLPSPSSLLKLPRDLSRSRTRTRTTTWRRFSLQNVFAYSQELNNTHFLFIRNLSTIIFIEGGQALSRSNWTMKLLTFENLFPPLDMTFSLIPAVEWRRLSGSIPAQITQLQACAQLRTRSRPRLTI